MVFYLEHYEFDMSYILWSTISLFLFLRVLLFYYSSKTGVDHYYWLMCVKNFKEQKKLPIKIENKYILEHNKQYYPPGFAVFLSFFSVSFLEKKGSYVIPILIDLICLVLTLSFCINYSIHSELLVVVCLYLSAPVLMVYNTQLTSRGLGNLFFLCSMLGYVVFTTNTELFIPLVILSSLFFALMYLTHKMTTQYCLFLFLLLIISSLNVQSAIYLLTTIFLGGVLSIFMVGFEFSKMQFLTHIEIISFWNRNWKNLGAHQFKDSKFYFIKNTSFNSKFHKPSLTGYINYLKMIFSYLPSLTLIPYAYMFFDIPRWLQVWLFSSIVITFSTLFIPKFRCLGGGHLYLFNTVVPVSICLFFGTNNIEEKILFLFVMLVSFFVNLIALYKRKARKIDDVGNINLITYLNTHKKMNIGVFPTTFAERVAYETEHNILWGAHGYSFLDVEPTWPISKMKLTSMFKTYDLKMIVVNLIWWKEIVDLKEFSAKFNTLYKTDNWIIFNLKK